MKQEVIKRAKLMYKPMSEICIGFSHLKKNEIELDVIS